MKQYSFLLFLGMLFSNLQCTNEHSRYAPGQEVTNLFNNLPILHTERLLLRPIVIDDAQDLFEIYSDYKTVQYMRITTILSNITEVQDRIQNNLIKRYENSEPCYWAVVLKEENKVIGLMGFVTWNPASFSAEVASMFNKLYWGHGFATEALKATLKCGFDRIGLNRIDATVYPENVASLRVHEKLGFKAVGLIPECYYYRDTFWDRILMVLCKKDYEAITR